ncbi:prolyl oligopeptidase family serine peptidase [Silvimonas sp.]|uniref:alpha/beta hydrolase family protein n=1 Tax=Silvimonas sp. TaxID=2650811 RepID=UPI00284F95C2|nr:prolyl oligopeptidase family serine peptidase [Silvimonas sp.]MDR3427363.1 prolyl oligopeptidase family serine peptidase [Silvimonas sp.]
MSRPARLPSLVTWLLVCICSLTLAACAGVKGVPIQAHSVPAAPAQTKVEFLERWDVAKLNNILQVQTRTDFGVHTAYTPARNAVNLYRITYPSAIPNMGNKPTTASGLLVIPETQSTSFPMVSYQHGTVYERTQVPSFPDNSPETQLMIAQFAGQGYVLIGADYFGLGTSTEPEGYMVKASHQQATYDMLMASREVLKQTQISTNKLFLAGWSQGGFVTMSFLQKLEVAGVKVDATATASAPLDLYALVSGALYYPRPNAAVWLNSIFILTAFSFENYYASPGLAHSVIVDKYYEMSKAAYDRKPFQGAIPTDLHTLLRPGMFGLVAFHESAFGQLLSKTEAYKWLFRSPVRNYYGEEDEAVTTDNARLAMTYAMKNGNSMVTAISTGSTDHRGTFASAVPEWKLWFDAPTH